MFPDSSPLLPSSCSAQRMPAKLNRGHAETNVNFFNTPASAQLPWPWRPAPSGADIAVGHRLGVSIERTRHVREGNAYRLASNP